MKSDDQENFELDEPAAKNHTPLGWPIQIIEIIPNGKAPKKYGLKTFRFGAAMTLSVILPRRGWTLVKKTTSYAYLIPPPDQTSQPFRISIAIPSHEECIELARRSFVRGISWMGQLGEWPASYFHEQNNDMREMWRDPETKKIATRLHQNPPISSFSIGQWGIWDANVTGVAGEFAIGVLPPSPVSTSEGSSLTGESILSEGFVKTVELTIYERNATARMLCIKHYGPMCQACGLNYEERYGAIGADLIHVHHVVPLSIIREEYQVDPIHDLIPLCANCHHVVHRRNPPYTLAEIRKAIKPQTQL